MSKKISLKHMVVGLLALAFIVPGDSNRKAYIMFMFLLLLFFERKLDYKCLLGVGTPRWIYVISYVSILLINYYKWSLPVCSLFLIVFFLGRYILIQGINDENAFNMVINAVLFVFSIYAILGIIEAFTRINVFDIILGRSFELYGANNLRGSIYRGHGISTVSINNAMIVYMAWMLATFKLYNKKKLSSIIEYILIGLHLILIFSRMLILVGLISQIIILTRTKRIIKLKVILLITAAIFVSMLIPTEGGGLVDSMIESFVPLIQELFGGKNHIGAINWGGTGERIIIWQWVFERMKGKLLFGNGFTTDFAYRYFYDGHYYTKQSIEVQWLYILFQKGLWGLVGYIVYQIDAIVRPFLMTKKENGVSFSFVFLVMTCGYFISLFSCAGLEDVQFFYLFFALFEAYERTRINHA